MNNITISNLPKSPVDKKELKEVLINDLSIKSFGLGYTSGLAVIENDKWVLSPNIRSFAKDIEKKLPKIEKKVPNIENKNENRKS